MDSVGDSDYKCRQNGKKKKIRMLNILFKKRNLKECSNKWGETNSGLSSSYCTC